MEACLALALALVPLAMLPGILLYWDITPKVVLLTGTAAVWLLAARLPAVLGSLAASRLGRGVLACIFLQMLSLVLSTLWSVSPSLSVSGSDWRRLGLPVQAALLLCFVASLQATMRGLRARLLLLRVAAVAACLCGSYVVAQYFNLDPLLDRRLYSVQAEKLVIRPPGTFGAGSYYANYAANVAFLALAMFRLEKQRVWRVVAAAAIFLSVLGTVLAGTRSAVLGIIAGCIVLLIGRWKKKPARRAFAVAGAVAVLATAFYISPAGGFVRNRVIQIAGDWKGGTRLLLWRDSIRMPIAHPLVGWGLDTFGSQFPKFESVELASDYPDVYNESPHNLVLDCAVSQGLVGVTALIGWICLAAFQIRRNGCPRGSAQRAIVAGLFATLVAHQFFCPTAPNALYLYFSLALLLGWDIRSVNGTAGLDGRRVLRGALLCARVAIAGSLILFTIQLWEADRSLGMARRSLSERRLSEAIDEYRTSREWAPAGFNASLWFSRMLVSATKAGAPLGAVLPVLNETARDAFYHAEERQNACYQFALLQVGQQQLPEADLTLRHCMELEPAWYRTYWADAVVLSRLGRFKQAQETALKGLTVSGKHRQDLLDLLASIRNQPGGGQPGR